MSRIIWNEAGQRRFDSGVDRAVLYPAGGIGVPWNGLVSVEETPTGGESTAHHFDGVNYLNRVSGQDYQGILEAYTYPDAFALYDGQVQIAPGLFATLQPRQKTFGLCYRTGMGNDLKGLEYAYKIHLIYNAIASPTSKSYRTRTKTVDLNTLKWTIKATPPPSTTFKPTAHFIVDSRFVSPAKLSELEDILYGQGSGYLDGGTASNVSSGVVDGGTPFSAGEGVIDGGTLEDLPTDPVMPPLSEIITLLQGDLIVA